MRILMITKYLPIQGGVSVQNYWLAQAMSALGHSVVVLTNADEVEDEFRIHLAEGNEPRLSGYHKPRTVRVISTKADVEEIFIPQSKPYTTKLVSLGLELVEEFQPNFIYAHYMEPYGVTALMLSKLTGVPFVIRHAGSDLGKLGLMPQMRTLHQRVYSEAVLVATRPSHHDYFTSVGVKADRLAMVGFRPYPPDVFFATPLPKPDRTVRLAIYGKTGRHKGTPQVIEAINRFRVKDISISLTAHWGGRYFQKYRERIESLGLEKTVNATSYVPHWQIADTIRDSHAVLYLENSFGIGIHTPVIPYEVMACGRLLITTREIAAKYPHIINSKSAAILELNPVVPDELCEVLSGLPGRMEEMHRLSQEPVVDATSHYAYGMNNLEAFLARVQDRL